MFCFLGFKIFESDKEGSFSIKLQRIMVSGVWSLWRDYKFWGKSLQEIFIKRFHFILITFHKSSRSNSFIFEYSRWCWDDQTLWGEISEINLPPPELQQFYSSQPQHLGSSNTDSPVLRYWGDTIALSIILIMTLYCLPTVLSLLNCHWPVSPKACRRGIDIRTFKLILQQAREWSLLWVSMTRIKRKVQLIFLSSHCSESPGIDDKAGKDQKLYYR